MLRSEIILNISLPCIREHCKSFSLAITSPEQEPLEKKKKSIYEILKFMKGLMIHLGKILVTIFEEVRYAYS